MGCVCNKAMPEEDSASALGANSSQLDAGSHSKKSLPPGYNPPLPPHIVGTFSNHGIEPDYGNNATVKINQDRGSIDSPFLGGDVSALFCVMDGHGRAGDKISEFCIMSLHDTLANMEKAFLTDTEGTFKKAYVAVDKSLEQRHPMDAKLSGTSAVTVYLRDSKLWIANAGDSRAVLASGSGKNLRVKNLSNDHNPDTPGEVERLRQCGGLVVPPEEEGLSARVWSTDRSVGLSMARSLGDHKLAQCGVIAEPEITTHDITGDDSIMILASDGIWEFITSEEACAIVARHPDDATAACRALIYTATDRWREEEGPYRDDITAIVVYMKPLLEHLQEAGAIAEVPASPGAGNTTSPPGAVPSGSPHELPHIQSRSSDSASGGGKSGKKGDFRRRRLSTMGGGAQEAQRKQALEAHGRGAAPVGANPKSQRKRRPSISPDMDPTGQQIEPR